MNLSKCYRIFLIGLYIICFLFILLSVLSFDKYFSVYYISSHSVSRELNLFSYFLQKIGEVFYIIFGNFYLCFLGVICYFNYIYIFDLYSKYKKYYIYIYILTLFFLDYIYFYYGTAFGYNSYNQCSLFIKVYMNILTLFLDNDKIFLSIFIFPILIIYSLLSLYDFNYKLFITKKIFIYLGSFFNFKNNPKESSKKNTSRLISYFFRLRNKHNNTTLYRKTKFFNKNHFKSFFNQIYNFFYLKKKFVYNILIINKFTQCDRTEDINSDFYNSTNYYSKNNSNIIPVSSININNEEKRLNKLNEIQLRKDHSNINNKLKTQSVVNQNSELDLKNDNNFNKDFSEYEQDISTKLVNVLNDFNINVKVHNIIRGPVITCYEIFLSKGTRVSKIVNLQDNISLALATSSIRIIAPIPGKSSVGIEIPNVSRDLVDFDSIIESAEFRENRYTLPIILGKEGGGEIFIVDLSTLPHLLIAGATGMGKSVFLNSLISGLIMSKSDKDLRFIMIDPKRVELKIYNDIPYLLFPVITNPKDSVSALKWALQEMERRYILLEKYSCRNISTFNKRIDELKKDENLVHEDYLNYIVIIIDEFADIILVCGKEVEGQIARLAAMSRAVGIHLILATQRPSVDIITGLIKANFPSRVAFQVSSKMESRIILDNNGAENLLGKGDMLFNAPAVSNLIRIQSAFLSENDVQNIIKRVCKGRSANYIEDLDEFTENKDISEEKNKEPLYDEAVQTILMHRKVSASYLQRRMKIGYNRAARIIELMEYDGIISEPKANNQRDILIENYTKI